ncbi:hypothetical protein MPSEU_000032500 [Mayamaea pseudoterrestris]|nr:hypothetical protein MPSEU_000032500 [Mayamaea pseudoterrestris]
MKQMKTFWSLIVASLITGTVNARLRSMQEVPTLAPSVAASFAIPSTEATSNSPVLAATASTTKPVCNLDFGISDSSFNEFAYPPIEILNANGDQVVFSFSQTWVNSALCQVAVDYSSESKNGDMVCDVQNAVAPGEVGVYRATCVNDIATITVYAQDETFQPNGNADTVPERCAPLQAGTGTIMHTIQIPCRVEPECCSPAPTCASTTKQKVIGMPETFGNGNVDGWLFGASAKENGRTCLVPGTETAKTFAVPSTADSVTIAFKALELESRSEMVLRIEDTLIDLDAVYDDGTEDNLEGYAGDVFVQSTPISDKINQVTVNIPSGWYAKTGRLTFGFAASTVGIDDFIMTADCSGGDSTESGAPSAASSPSHAPTSKVVDEPPSLAPTYAPTLTTVACSDDIEFLEGSLSDFEASPIQVLEYSSNGSQIVFSASQTLSDQPLCHMAVDYTNANGGDVTCNVLSPVPPGEFGVYSAQCIDGYADVTLYAQDGSLNGSNPSIPSRCSGLASNDDESHTQSFVTRIPCQANPYCPSSTSDSDAAAASICRNHPNSQQLVMKERFEAFSDWLYGEQRSYNGKNYLAPSGSETSKTYVVPREALALKVCFTIYDHPLSSSSSSSVHPWQFRVNDYGLEVGNTNATGFFGNIELKQRRNVGSSNKSTHASTRMELVVPSDWYQEHGRLTLGLVRDENGDDSSTMSLIGMDDLQIDAVCP